MVLLWLVGVTVDFLTQKSNWPRNATLAGDYATLAELLKEVYGFGIGCWRY